MKISMWMVHDTLDSWLPGAILHSSLDAKSDKRSLIGVLPSGSLDEGTCDEEHVFVIDAADSVPARALEGSRYLAVVDDGRLQLDRFEGFQILVLDCTIIHDSGAAHRIIESIFENYRTWGDELQNELATSCNLNRICEIGRDALDNGIMVFDRDYTIFASAFDISMPVRNWTARKGSILTVNPGWLEHLTSKPAFIDTFKTRGVAYFDDRVDGNGASLYINLGDTGDYEGRIVVVDDVREFRRGDRQVLEIFHDILKTALQRPRIIRDDLAEVFHVYLKEMLGGRAIDDRQLADSLRLWNWPRIGRFVCAVMELSETSIEVSTDAYIRTALEERIAGSCAVRLDHEVVCIAEITDLGGIGGFEERLSTLSMPGFPIGLSRVFEDVLMAAEYHIEASVALRYGESENPSGEGFRIHRFENHALRFLFEEGTTRLRARHFCHPDVLGLERYRTGKVDLYTTLETYLAHDMNLLRSSEALGIHRTTMFNRLEHIRALITSNLEDPDEREYLRLSFALLRMERGRPAHTMQPRPSMRSPSEKRSDGTKAHHSFSFHTHAVEIAYSAAFPASSAPSALASSLSASATASASSVLAASKASQSPVSSATSAFAAASAALADSSAASSLATAALAPFSASEVSAAAFPETPGASGALLSLNFTGSVTSSMMTMGALSPLRGPSL